MSDKVKKIVVLIRSILPSIYFNFHYLPFGQAIKLPILLYKPSFQKCKGRVIIEGGGKFWPNQTRFPFCVDISKLWDKLGK